MLQRKQDLKKYTVTRSFWSRFKAQKTSLMSAEDYVARIQINKLCRLASSNADLQWHLQTEDVATPVTFTLLKDAIAGLLLQEYLAVILLSGPCSRVV